jgi:large subunit ribosomal protein L7A
MQIGKTMSITGYRQVIRALDAGTLVSAQIAVDADAHMKETLLTALQSAKVPYEFVNSKEALGKLCGINVGAACAGIVKVESNPFSGC